MTGRERVTKALTFSRPDRAPRDLWALPYVELFRHAEWSSVLERFPPDIDRMETSPGSGEARNEQLARSGSYTDEWGSVWEVAEPGIIGEVKRPALADWSALKRYRPPWETIRGRDLSHVDREREHRDRFMLSAITARPFERLQFVRGTENVFYDLADDSPQLRRLLEMIHEFYLEDVRQWARSGVDAVFIMDDWGTNDSLLIDPVLWRALFKPLYKAYCDVIHAAGKFVFMHSDGHTAAILEDLIEVGVDALNTQLFCMDIEDLARRGKGRLTFWGEMDRQWVLPFGTQDDVRTAVRRVRGALDDGTGGVIAQCEWGKDNGRENIEALFEAWMDRDR